MKVSLFHFLERDDKGLRRDYTNALKEDLSDSKSELNRLEDTFDKVVVDSYPPLIQQHAKEYFEDAAQYFVDYLDLDKDINKLLGKVNVRLRESGLSGASSPTSVSLTARNHAELIDAAGHEAIEWLFRVLITDDREWRYRIFLDIDKKVAEFAMVDAGVEGFSDLGQQLYVEKKIEEGYAKEFLCPLLTKKIKFLPDILKATDGEEFRFEGSGYTETSFEVYRLLEKLDRVHRVKAFHEAIKTTIGWYKIIENELGLIKLEDWCKRH